MRFIDENDYPLGFSERTLQDAEALEKSAFHAVDRCVSEAAQTVAKPTWHIRP
jgi:hypothetical protein